MSMSATGFENDATGAWDMTLGDRNSLELYLLNTAIN